MIQDQFIGEDSEASRSLVEDQQRAFETRVVLKRVTAYTGSSQDKGIAQTRSNVLIETSASMRLLTGRDIIVGGGLYALGDIEITTQIPVFGADTPNATQADKMMWSGREYTLRGMPYPVPMAGGVTFYKSVWRQA